MVNQKVFTTGEIARYCNVTYRSVLKWIEDGKLKAKKTAGRHNRIDVTDFIAFLKKYNMAIPDELRGIKETIRILIVDDDKNMVRSLKRALRLRKEFEIDVASDGFEAGRKLFEFLPRIVVLDIRMAGIDGYGVAKQIKASDRGDDTKIIAVSGFFSEDGKDKIRKLGADVCLDKPFDPALLIKQIEKLA